MDRSIVLFFLVGFISLVGCTTIPKGESAVKDFNITDYLGKWYEIARLDFVFERGLNNTTAEYYVVDNKKYVAVRNRGFDYKAKKWKEAKGKVRFRGSEETGELEVSFFGPFWSAYNIIALDNRYQYALIAGKNTKYLWLLSRSPNMPEEIKKQYIDLAESLGFNTDELIWVEHSE